MFFVALTVEIQGLVVAGFMHGAAGLESRSVIRRALRVAESSRRDACALLDSQLETAAQAVGVTGEVVAHGRSEYVEPRELPGGDAGSGFGAEEDRTQIERALPGRLGRRRGTIA